MKFARLFPVSLIASLALLPLTAFAGHHEAGETVVHGNEAGTENVAAAFVKLPVSTTLLK